MALPEGVPVEQKFVPCRFDHGAAAVGRYETPDGCVCFPEDRVQDLCAQHVVKDGMIGPNVRLVLIYWPPFYDEDTPALTTR